MIIVTDHHHIGDLERRVVEPFCDQQEIRCIGDLSVHQMLASETSLCKAIQIDFRKRKGLAPDAELTFDEKCEMTKKKIRPSDKKAFREWKILYGATPIYNLARKVFINEKVKKSPKKEHGFIGLMSHEKLLTAIQLDVASKMGKKYVINLLDTIEKYRPDIAECTYNLLRNSGVNEPRKHIVKTLHPRNFGGKLPTSESVFAEYPRLKYFQFKRDIYWELLDKTMVVYVPLFEIHDDFVLASRHIEDINRDYEAYKPESVMICYHGNPHPEGMGGQREDSNLDLILPLVNLLYDLTGKNIRMFCGHLHKSAEPYEWNFLDKRSAIIHPINVDEFYEIDTQNPSNKPSKRNIYEAHRKHLEKISAIKEEKK